MSQDQSKSRDCEGHVDRRAWTPEQRLDELIAWLETDQRVKGFSLDAVASLREVRTAIRSERGRSDCPLCGVTPETAKFCPPEVNCPVRYQWVSVKDRMPPTDGLVIVQGGVARWNGTEWRTMTGYEYPGRPIQWEVTHWMPMPTLPAERNSS